MALVSISFDDGRRRDYGLTDAGADVLVNQLDKLLEDAEATKGGK